MRTNALLGRRRGGEWALTWLSPDAERRKELALIYAGRARTLSALREDAETIRPVGTEGLYAEYTIFQLFVQRMLAAAAQLEKEAKEAKLPAQKAEIQKIVEGRKAAAQEASRRVAVTVLEQLRRQDPTSPQLAYLIAQTWDAAGDRAKRDEAVASALSLDARVGEARKLTSAQRGQLEEWEKK